MTVPGRPRLALASRARFPGGAGRVWIAGGGSVGHLAPGFAVAHELRRRGVEVRFVTPGQADERHWFPDDEPAPLTTPAPRLPRRIGAVPAFGPRLAMAVRRATRLLDRHRPGAVLALGGWPCVPTALAGLIRRVPVCLLASDATPGVAVRWLRRGASRIYVAQASAAAALGPTPRILHTGPVLRRAVIEGRRDPARFGLDDGRATLFVTGGSLGASALNLPVARGLADVVRERPGLRDLFQVLHATGRSGDGVAAAYLEAGIRAHVTPFVKEVGVAYRTADLVLCRAGAMTCAELEATGRPAVLVPYPHHADRQQFANAEPLVARGAAILLPEADLLPGGIQDPILDLLQDPTRLAAMGALMARPGGEAAGRIAGDLIRWLERAPRGARRAMGADR